MDIKLLHLEFILEFVDNPAIIQHLCLMSFYKYLFELARFELEIMCIEHLLPKMIHPHMMKAIPSHPANRLISAMIKIIIEEFQYNQLLEISLC